MTGLRLGRAGGMLMAMIVVGAAMASAAFQSPREIIESFGLVKEGRYFVLPKVENEVKEHLNVVLPLVDTLDDLFDQWAANESKKYMVVALNQEIALVQAQFQRNQAMFNQLDTNPVVAKFQRQELNANATWLQNYRAELVNSRDNVQSQVAAIHVQEAHLEKVAKARGLFLEACDAMTPSLNRLKDAYNKVTQDPKFDSIIRVLRDTTKLPQKIGPSEAILKSMDRVNMAKKTLDPKVFQPKKFTPRRPPRAASKTSKK
jgi:hypothetical protein